MCQMSRPGPTPTVTNEELIGTIRTHNYPVVDAEIVANEVGLSREQTRQRLNRMAEEGVINRATLNKNSVVYWYEN